MNSMSIAHWPQMSGGARKTAMDIHHIRYFLAVCETLNFTRAAEKCNVTQPALSRAVQRTLPHRLSVGPPLRRQGRGGDRRCRWRDVSEKAQLRVSRLSRPSHQGSWCCAERRL